MAEVTLELYKVLQYSGATLNGDGDYVNYNIGLHDYPIWDAAYRDTLNRKIINRYLNREIGYENPERFVHRLRSTMHEIMPAYVSLYETTVMGLDMTRTVDIKTLTTGAVESLRTGSSTSDQKAVVGAKARTINSDYPQFSLAGNADYASNGSDANSQNTSTGEGNTFESSSGTDHNDTESSTTGYQAMPAELILAARSVIINIDLAIIEDPKIANLFLGIWETGEEWSPDNWKGIAL